MNAVTQPQEAPPTRRLKFEEVSNRVGLGRTAIYARIKAGKFPAPVKDGSASRWLESQVNAYVNGTFQEATA